MKIVTHAWLCALKSRSEFIIELHSSHWNILPNEVGKSTPSPSAIGSKCFRRFLLSRRVLNVVSGFLWSIWPGKWPWLFLGIIVQLYRFLTTRVPETRTNEYQTYRRNSQSHTRILSSIIIWCSLDNFWSFSFCKWRRTLIFSNNRWKNRN